MFLPQLFDNSGMDPFYYTAEDWGADYDQLQKTDPNIQSWMDFSKSISVGLDQMPTCTEEQVIEAIYKLGGKELQNKNSKNNFIRLLHQLKRTDVVDYIIFAKSTNGLNEAQHVSWGWEKEEKDVSAKQLRKMKQAQKLAKSAKDPFLKRRYAYLGIRLGHYYGASDIPQKLFDTHVSGTNEDIIYWWSKYFMLQNIKSSTRKNVELANVFMHTPSKREGIFWSYDFKLAKSDVLAEVKNDQERAAVLTMYLLRERGPAKKEIEKIRRIDPNFPLLDYLIVREINKLEDWIFTNHYSAFPPAITSVSKWGENSDARLKVQLEKDKLYGYQFADWLRTISTKESVHQPLMQFGASYVMNMIGDQKDAIAWLDKVIEKDQLTSDQKKLAKQLHLLYRIRDGLTYSLITNDDQELIMDTTLMNRTKFLFSIGREWEFAGDKAAAIAMFSQWRQDSWSEGQHWRSDKGRSTLLVDFYSDYFYYMDAQFSATDVDEVINFINSPSPRVFDQWAKMRLKLRMNRLYDLLGTSYMRMNDLPSAIQSWKSVDDYYWKSEDQQYDIFLRANPFYTDFNNEHKPTKADTIWFTKPEIAQKLNQMIHKTMDESISVSEKSKLYYHIANCYFNMTHNGNSWMMKRYWWSSWSRETNLADDDEYHTCGIAKKYFLLAKETSEDEKVQALCLRMAGRCEKYRLYWQQDYYSSDYSDEISYSDFIFRTNTYYKQLKDEYPDDYDQLIENCYSFERYYARL